MDRRATGPELRVREAKARLLEAAAGADPLAWARRHPWALLGGAAAAGLATGGFSWGALLRFLLFR